MVEPARFYCDMTTDGGGWVLVGKGRNDWTRDHAGQGAPSQLLSPVTAPMSAATVQLGSRAVDALLDGGRVDDLTDGVRLRRAQDTAGATWQESRVRFSRFGRWAWTLGAVRGLASWSFEDRTGTGGESPSYGADEGYDRVRITSAYGRFHKGFAFGTSVRGSSSPTSHLWSATDGGGALPSTQVYLRPRVLSTDAGFTRIPNRGAAGYRQGRIVRSTALASPWGVSGVAGNTDREGNVEVQAFTQSGRTMYVGGNFEFVQRDASGTDRVRQPFLAAFDVVTGERVRRFRPRLDEQVHALATLPDGSVVAAGEFTRANDRAATAIVALDPATGATRTRFRVRLRNESGTLRVRALALAGRNLYIGGAVTDFSGGPRSVEVHAQGLGRVLASNGTPSTRWTPLLNGSVRGLSMAPDGSRVYAVGYFTKARTRYVRRAAALRTSGRGLVARPLWRPTWSNANDYQQAVDAVGRKVWVGGSQHSLFQFDSATLTRTMGDIFNPRGDVQAIANSRGVVYAGCHCDDYAYHNAYTYPALPAGWTSADAIGWFGAWRASTGRRVPGFVPEMTTRIGSGIWALAPDSRGVIWAGGDVLTARTSRNRHAFAGGFARFPVADSTAPTVPTRLRVRSRSAGRVTLAWGRSAGRGGRVHYVVLRDDRPIAATTRNTTRLRVPLGGANRFYLRAVDSSGNYSASTRVLRVGR
jgi:hypothetical protein